MKMVPFLIRHKKMSIIILAMIVLIVMGLILTGSHWWGRVTGARITYQGQHSNSSNLYQSSNGILLVSLEKDGEGGLYVIDPYREMIGMPNRSRFLLLPGYAYSKDVPPLTVSMTSVKIEITPDLIIKERYVEFNSFDKGRVQVAW